MKSVVVFGGSGFIGSYVADELSRRGYSVTVADIANPTSLGPKQHYRQIDMMNLDDVVSVISKSDIVFNFAGLANLEEAAANPLRTVNLNVVGNLNILEGCRRADRVERFVYASSAYALSAEGSFYGISKCHAEKLTAEYFKKYGLKYTVIRYGSLYGERASHNNYIYNLLKNAIRTNELTYVGDDDDIREYIHAADAAKLSVNIIENKEYENEHIVLTGVEKLKRRDLMMMINEIMQCKLEVKQVCPDHQGHYKVTPYAFQPSLAKKLTANPYIDLGQGLLECIQHIHKELER